MLALELVERMIAAGVKIICLDLTNQDANHLPEFFNSVTLEEERAHLQHIGEQGAGNHQQNVEDGGSVNEFREALEDQLRPFLTTNNAGYLRVYNPSTFEVWRQTARCSIILLPWQR